MAILLPQDSLVLNAYAVLVGQTPGNAAFSEHKAYIATNGEAGYKAALNSVFANYTTAQLATSLLNNLGLSSIFTQADAEAYLAANATNRVGAMMDLASQLYSYAGDNAALVAAKAAYVNAVDGSYNYSINTANISGATLTGTIVSGGQTFTLTTGVDAITGTTSNDTISATNTATSAVLGGLDVVDGAAGTDTLAIADTATAVTAAFSLPAGFTVKNVEVLKVTTNGSLGDDASAATAFNTTGMTGLTSLEVTTAGDGTTDTSIITADTTDVTLTASAAQDVDVLGGKVVSVTGGATASTITGAALTAVTVKTSAGMTIDNTDTVANGSTTAVGTTLKSVTLDAVDSDTAIKGKAIDTLTLKNATASTNTVTITNATAAHSLTLNVDGTGYDATAAAQAQTVADAQAKSLTINATGSKSNIAVTTGAGNTVLTNATITGSAALAVNFDSANNTKLASIDGSAATGNLTLTNTAVATTIKTGAGNDTFTVTASGTATVTSTVATGAGNDVVTISGGLNAGSTIALGDGNDTLIGTTVIDASTATAITSVDGGAGTDSLSSTLINAGNAAKFVNFETISIGNATVDAALLTASTITGLSIDGSTGTGVLQNVTQSQSLSVNANNGGTSSTLTFSGVTGTSDAYAISFNANTTGTTASPTSIDAKIVSIAGIEAVTVHSGAAAGVVTNAIALNDAAARTLTIDGAQALNVTFDTAFGTAHATTGLSSIDGSAATGKLGINLANTGALTAGLVVKGGSAVDTITTIASQATTLTGNAGNDSFVVAATIAGTTDAATAYVTTITDFTKGDTITFADIGNSAFTATKVDVSAAISLDAAVDLAVAGDGSANEIVTWFNYGNDTYLVVDGSASGTLAATADQIIKLTGTLDLSTSSMTTAAVFTFA